MTNLLTRVGVASEITASKPKKSGTTSELMGRRICPNCFVAVNVVVVVVVLNDVSQVDMIVVVVVKLKLVVVVSPRGMTRSIPSIRK